MDWTPVRERIIKDQVLLQTYQADRCSHLCTHKSQDADEEGKDEFYMRLQEVLQIVETRMICFLLPET